MNTTDLEAARLLLARMGITPEQLLATTPADPWPMPTFRDYIPQVAAAVPQGTRRAYATYWRRITDTWGDRRIDEPTPLEIKQLCEQTKNHVITRKNSRGGRCATEHLIAAFRCLYRHATADRLITGADNPALRVNKPRRLPSNRRAIPNPRLAEIIHTAATTGNDPDLDTLLLRLHTETACRRGGALALRPHDLDPEQCLILLHEKGETTRWQPISPTLMHALTSHHQQRGDDPNELPPVARTPGVWWVRPANNPASASTASAAPPPAPPGPAHAPPAHRSHHHRATRIHNATTCINAKHQAPKLYTHTPDTPIVPD